MLDNPVARSVHPGYFIAFKNQTVIGLSPFGTKIINYNSILLPRYKLSSIHDNTLQKVRRRNKEKIKPNNN